MPHTVQRPSVSPQPATRDDRIPAERQAHPRDTWETERDHRFAQFLREKAGGMIRQTTVGIDRSGKVRVELSDKTDPDDALPLTKSILAGARKDFPDRPIRLWLYDPSGELILTARYRPDEGTQYQIAHGGGESRVADRETAKSEGAAGAQEALTRGGATARDQKFASWAEEHGKPYLRYVQADLERHGRLWFGVTREVKPDDLQDLTKALLEGAGKEFPERELTATVFDPSGERIGRARRSPDGRVTWEQ